MKRLCSIIILLAVLVGLTACGNSSQTGQTDADSGATSKKEAGAMNQNGLGTYSLEDDTCVSSVSEALKRGVRLIDTAYMYHNEEEVGKAVRDSGIPREEIFVITKLYPNQFSEPEKAIDEALKKLDIEYIDMMLLHHPGTDDVKAYKAMEKAVEDGKIRSIGLSNWYVEELKQFLPLQKHMESPLHRLSCAGICKRVLSLLPVPAIRSIYRRIQSCMILNCRMRKWRKSTHLTGMRNMTGIKGY